MSPPGRRRRAAAAPRRGAALALSALLVLAPALAAAAPAERVVSLNPSLTAILVAIGAGSALVGVDDFSARRQPEVRDLPRVGGLFNPSLEAVVALGPDLVVLVPGAQQRGVADRLRELGIPVLELPNLTLEQLLDSIRELGERVGREQAARARVEAIRSTWRRVGEARVGRPRPRAVLVLQRDPLFVVGSGSFIDAMLERAGFQNLAGAFSEPYPRVAVEWLIAARPEVLLDSSEDPEPAAEYWARWPSLPAVATGRVVAVPAETVTFPGPALDSAVERLAEIRDGAVPTGAPAAP